MATRFGHRGWVTVAIGALVIAGVGPAMVASPVWAEGPEHAVTSDVELLTAQPIQALETALGPVSGLAALVRHLTVGDPESTIEPRALGPEVALVQSRLDTLGFRPGPIDGTYGGQTYSAVLALQKHEGLERTGLVDPITRAALAGLVASGPRDDLLGDRIEIDPARQIIFLVVGKDVSVINTSTGNGEPYIRYNGATAIARTPRGDFAISQRYDGNQVGFLGTLYRPMYFSGPFAIHGSGSVPGYAASHGCARTSFDDMDFLWTVIAGDMQVYSYDRP